MQLNTHNNTVKTQLPVLRGEFYLSMFLHDQAIDVAFQLRKSVERLGPSQDALRQTPNQLRNIARPPFQLPSQSYPVTPNMSALPPNTGHHVLVIPSARTVPSLPCSG
jgi:hypothetical protein